MKILIFAFPRSGTSLTYRLFKRHYDVDKMYFESLLLWRHQNKKLKTIFPAFKKGVNAGEKIIYEKRNLGKGKKFKVWPYIKYCDEWNRLFKKEARIIQVVRHPYDQWNSIIKKKYLKRNRSFVINSWLRHYFDCVSEYTQKVIDYPNSFSFKYEELIQNPDEMIPKLYEFCDLDIKNCKEHEVMRSSRSFGYERYGHMIDNIKELGPYKKEYWNLMNTNIDSILDVYNKIDGPIYKK